MFDMNIIVKIPDFRLAPCCPTEPKVPQPIDQSNGVEFLNSIITVSRGLFAALLLDIAGLKNIEILECQERVGGRVHTESFSDNVTKDKLYGELGDMRLPKGTDGNINKHQMVFDTINYLNEENSKNENNYEKDYKIDLIDFIFTDQNGSIFLQQQTR
ncbi:hypothetical protein RhiirA4_458042 [Rhizophagus irregularis]|uniref:Amine oxidase domain-containing protein n=1 Tax=Rhizophagus irregularis TaxID=588596 RepID=A0A2I1GBB4_9GLOM|nr:hypothetical protein RhiirA4_458042 [Rhizophagus irregularis]